ncbi:calcium uniporter protein, mitochondrial isoform X1 [Prorops nasuta]|uniref:calcium uniporter protein, mitochondrial isoform X1 n=1 Tax=Prorops nasuta TaxID=863751 RepID=UPI0034CFEB5B
MATVSCRASFVLRWYELSRVFSAPATLATTKYRKETWCRRWWHISQRSLSTTSTYYGPTLSPILRKDTKSAKGALKEPKDPTEWKESKGKTTETGDAQVPEVAVTYFRGLPRITVPLPSRKESCMFTLKPITHTVGDFLQMLRTEDRGIDRAVITTIDDVRISCNTTIEMLMEDKFKLIVNDVTYNVAPPAHQRQTMEDIQKLSDVQETVAKLYETLHVREYHVEMEKQVLAELEQIRLQLEPLEQQLRELEQKAVRRANLFVRACLVLMSAQFSGLARLTWWEYSWDIMEPVTYFVTYGTTIAWFIYFLVTKQEYMLPDVYNRQQLIALHRRARKAGLDLNLYNQLKDKAYELEMTLKIIRGPLYELKTQIEQKKRARSSSSSSRSPSSSPSPSPSPSPERTLPRKNHYHHKGPHLDVKLS